MTDANKTEIICILDRSGSMARIADDMKGGFDKFIADQRALPGTCLVSLVQFDERIEDVYWAVPVGKVPPCELQPRGSTALLDAIGFTISKVGGRLAALPEHERPSKVLVFIVTDGQENASTEHSWSAIGDMIEHQKKKYSWEFVFLGTSAEALEHARKLGIEERVKYTAAQGLQAQAVFGSLSSNVAKRRAGKSITRGSYQMNYDQTSKKPSS